MVLESVTGEPVAGARVYAVWKRRLRNSGGQTSEETARKIGLVTSGDGCFEIPPYFLFNPAPDPGEFAGSFAFMVYADGYKICLYTFRDSGSMTSYGPYDWREIAPVSRGERMTIRLSKIPDAPESTSRSEEPGPRPVGAASNGENSEGCRPFENDHAEAGRPDAPGGAMEAPSGSVQERLRRARKRIAEESGKH